MRTGTALFFLVAVGALNEMRQRRPDAGCGCFGELSGIPIGLSTIARPGLLCVPPSPPSACRRCDAGTDEVLGPTGTRESAVL